MIPTGFFLERLLVRGPGKADAVLDFIDGLNVVAGASDTGKSYAVSCIDYLFGASKPPRSIEAARGYDTVLGTMTERATGHRFEIERTLAGGDVIMRWLGSKGETIETKTVGAKHDGDNAETLSGHLLRWSGLWGKQLRKNAKGEKRSLSFRDLAFLIVVDEERIIAERPPHQSGQPQDRTLEGDALRLLATGEESGRVIAQPSAKEIAGQKAKGDLVDEMLSEALTKFKNFGIDEAALPAEIERIEASRKTALTDYDIARLSTVELEAKLAQLSNDLREVRSRAAVVEGLRQRFDLLDEHYESDAKRLEAIEETGLVAETDEGLMLMATTDISVRKLRGVIDAFELSNGHGQAGDLLEVYTGPDDPRRLEQILAPEVLALWPFVDGNTYTLDLAIHSAGSTRSVKFPTCRRRESQGETEEAFAARREEVRRPAREAATEAWYNMVDQRYSELRSLITHYNGVIIAGPMNEAETEVPDGLVFPDSFQVRVKMSGAGLKDVVFNFAHLFEVACPADITRPEMVTGAQGEQGHFRLSAPTTDAPAVCVIDSGIQESHRWLSAAIDSATSRNFIPGMEASAVEDEVSPRGHGTRVAGSVIYPSTTMPRTGTVQSAAWIQNARVLDADNRLSDALPPERYLAAVVNHFAGGPRTTKIFNHSINSAVPCRQRRMSAWAAKIDQLSHQQAVLFIQSVGNISSGLGTDANPGLRSHVAAGRTHPTQLLEESSRVANPAQSLHALTVGSIGHGTFDEQGWRSFASVPDDCSGFSRAGYAPPWDIVKPEVVEFGGDYCHSKVSPYLVRLDERTSVELVSSTLHGEPAIGRDGAGTSFAAPKVAHIAARLQSFFPDVSPLLYRALIVQSARWPAWAETATDKDRVLRLIGYGRPDVARATTNAATRVTLITAKERALAGKQYHLFVVRIPEELHGPAQEANIRIDVTLAYTAEPRRTRARNRSYLETWLEWESSRRGEPIEDFRHRIEHGGSSHRAKFPWVLDDRDDRGDVEGTNRTRGSVQKDWAVFPAYDLPAEFAIAVRGHLGWNHRAGEGKARYCLVVSFEALDGQVQIYEAIRAVIEAETLVDSSVEVEVTSAGSSEPPTSP